MTVCVTAFGQGSHNQSGFRLKARTKEMHVASSAQNLQISSG